MKELYQTPKSIGENPVNSAIEDLQKRTASLENFETIEKLTKLDLSNVVMIGDSYGAGWFPGVDTSTQDSNNWQVYLAENLKLTNYRRYAKSGLCCNIASENSLNNFYLDTIKPAEINNDVSLFVIMLGLNDSLTSNLTNTINGLETVIAKIKSNFTNADIIVFAEPTWSLRDLKYLRAYKIACGSQAIFIEESSTWLTNNDNMVRSDTSPNGHPNPTASHLISDNMTLVIKSGIIPTSYVRQYLTGTAPEGDSLNGGVVLEVIGKNVNIYVESNLFTSNPSYHITMCKGGTIPEALRTNKQINVCFFDLQNYVPGSHIFYPDGGVIRAISNNTLTSSLSGACYTQIPIIKEWGDFS